MSNVDTPSGQGSSSNQKVQQVTESVNKVTNDPVIREILLAKHLSKSAGNSQAGGSSTSDASDDTDSPKAEDVSAFKAAGITAQMVAKAERSQLEEWEQLDHDWDDEVWESVSGRLETMRAEESQAQVTTQAQSTAPQASSNQQQKPAKKELTPEEAFAASLKQPAVFLKRPLVAMFETHADLAEEVRDTYNTDNNPVLPEDLLVRLAQAKLLWREHDVYRISVGGQNGVVYKFFLDEQGKQNPVGEWHVHWGPQNKAETPGWKKGKNGEKADSNIQNMRTLLGNAWGSTTAGARSQV